MIKGSDLTLGQCVYVYSRDSFTEIPVDTEAIRDEVRMFVVVFNREYGANGKRHLYGVATGGLDQTLVDEREYAETVDEALLRWIKHWRSQVQAMKGCIEAVEAAVG